jgi:DNA-binding NtrC family response regulator
MPASSQSILVLHNAHDFLESAQYELCSLGLHTETVSSYVQFVEVVENSFGTSVIIEWLVSEGEVEDILTLVAWKYPYIPTIVLASKNVAAIAEGCIKQGVFDVITKPVELNRLTSSIHRALQYNDLFLQNRQLEDFLLGATLTRPEIFEHIITINPIMQGIFKIVETIGRTTGPVLITGEPGVDKKLIAKAVHEVSWQKGAFVTLSEANFDMIVCDEFLGESRHGIVNVENETSDSLFAKAQGGTIFLDEVGNLWEGSQVNLLRLLKKLKNYRFIMDAGTNSNIRFVAASIVDFSEKLSRGTFRRDLYHLLCTHQIQIPPLRERREDIPLLAQSFIKKAAANLKKRTPRITDEAMMRLNTQDYPGNVGELASILNKAVACDSTGLITINDLPVAGFRCISK